jgi:hypothetical protein
MTPSRDEESKILESTLSDPTVSPSFITLDAPTREFSGAQRIAISVFCKHR